MAVELEQVPVCNPHRVAVNKREGRPCGAWLGLNFKSGQNEHARAVQTPVTVQRRS